MTNVIDADDATEITEPERIDFERLAYDVALKYNTPEELCLQHGLSQGVFDRIADNPVFQQAVVVAEREITEQGTEFKLKARKLSSEVLDQLAVIALDDKASHTDRIKAISELAKLAGHHQPEPASATAAAGFQVNIQLNQNNNG